MPTSRPSINIRIIDTSKPTNPTEQLFAAAVSINLGGLTVSNITTTVKLSLRQAAAKTFRVPLEDVSEPIITAYTSPDYLQTYLKSNRRLTQNIIGVTVSFVITVPGTSSEVVKSSVQATLQSSSSSYTTLVTQYAQAAGVVLPKIDFLSAVVKSIETPTIQVLTHPKVDEDTLTVYSSVIIACSVIGFLICCPIFVVVYYYYKWLVLYFKYPNLGCC